MGFPDAAERKSRRVVTTSDQELAWDMLSQLFASTHRGDDDA
jgi:hypothetical protein